MRIFQRAAPAGSTTTSRDCLVRPSLVGYRSAPRSVNTVIVPFWGTSQAHRTFAHRSYTSEVRQNRRDSRLSPPHTQRENILRSPRRKIRLNIGNKIASKRKQDQQDASKTKSLHIYIIPTHPYDNHDTNTYLHGDSRSVGRKPRRRTTAGSTATGGDTSARRGGEHRGYFFFGYYTGWMDRN